PRRRRSGAGPAGRAAADDGGVRWRVARSQSVPGGLAVDEAAQLVPTMGHAPPGDAGHRLPDDVPVHLRVADLPLDEGDRDLDDGQPGTDGAHGEVGLEAVAGA